MGLNSSGDFAKAQKEDDEPLNLEYLITLKKEEMRVVIPGRATFGGVWPATNFDEFKKVLCGVIRMTGSRDAVCTLPPEYFYPDVFKAQKDFIEAMGGSVLFNDVSFHIEVEKWDISKLSKGNRKKIRQCYEQNVVFRREHLLGLGEVYELIRRNRSKKGVVPSMGFQQLVDAIEAFPNEYQVFALYLSENMIASAVTVLITPEIRYVYMWADDENFRSLSPVATLCNEIVEYSRKDGIKIVDLGTASLNGVLDVGLARFKLNLGAVQTLKPSMTIDVSSCR